VDEVLGYLPGCLDQQGPVQAAAPFAAEQIGALGVVRDAAQHGGRGIRLREHLLNLAEGGPELLVIGHDHHADAEAASASALSRRGKGGRAVAQPDHVSHVHPAHEDDRRGLGEQVVERSVGAEPTAVRDHIRLRQRGKHLADRTPEQAESAALLGVGHTRQHVEAAVQFLRVFPDLMRSHASPGDDSQAEHPTARVEVTAARRRKPVDEVSSGGVAFGQQNRAWPHSRERQCRCRDTWRSLVGRDRDQRHDHPAPVPGVRVMAMSPAEA
jgi:hypothetical protein